MMRARCCAVLMAFCAALAMVVSAAAQTKLLRFPDIHGDKVVFTYAGDLWTASTSGGIATRLTAHPGEELFAKFSPDGKWIAFTGQYDGDEQVYVIPSTGGVPRQLTFYPSRGPLPARWGWDNQVYGWTPDGKQIVFRSLRDYFDLADSKLYTVPLDGGLPQPLPMPKSGAGDLSPDGKQVVYSPLFRDFRTWKRYAGGWAQQLYIFDLNTHAVEKITTDPRCHRDPMWIGDKIYFDSDMDGTLNLYSYDPKTKETVQLTKSTQWDLRWPSTDHQGRIVYEQGGELNIFDIATRQSTHLSIEVPDDGLSMRPAEVSAARQIEWAELSPKGERALMAARGDIFTAPIEKGPTRNLTDSSNAHDKLPVWSPDGASIAFISDMDGEDELYRIGQDGTGKPEELTHGLQAMLYQPSWSPDGKRIAFSDKDGKLYVLTLEDKKLVQIAQNPRGKIPFYPWSPDSGYLAFTMDEPSGFTCVYIWRAADGQIHRVTDPMYDSNQPVWDPAGNYLYFIGQREFQPQLSQIEFNFAANRGVVLLALTLRKDGKNPFPPESDEVTVTKPAEVSAENKKPEEKKDESAGAKKEEQKPEPLRIDFDGLADRVTMVPVEAGNYTDLAATKEYLVYRRVGASYYGRESYPPPALILFSIKDRKESTLAEKADGFVLSRDGTKALVRDGRTFKLYDAKPGGKEGAKTVSTDGMTVHRVPRQEWVEIFNEVYRRYRDFFYAANMNGYDWKALHDQYRPLVDYVAHRSDLNYVLGEMVAELSNSHTYITGGDFEIPKRTPVALPGARIELDPQAGRYRIAKIYRGLNDEENYRSPLTEVGVDAQEGDYILEIDGRDLTAKDNPYELLRGKAGHAVQLRLNSKPVLDGSRTTSFKPITDEEDLIYLDWVTHNREAVDKATGGKVGYIHLPDMGENGIREFIRTYYPQIRKQALIVDDRGNGGGNISQMVIQRLDQPLLGTWFDRVDQQTGTYPDSVFYGPKVCLINETSASDGDIFPYMFRKAGMGPLIGKRTWGGTVGIADREPLLDGGTVFVPESALASPEGKYVVEGHGVDPDIEVENEPEAVIQGRDPQLERAIAEIEKALEAGGKTLPARPPDPDRTQKH
ncbi:MAG: S41 family peptidase [Terracidiphilus sp.]